MTWWMDLKKYVDDHDSEKIISMLSEVSVVEARDDCGNNLLHYITVCDNEIITSHLIAAGCDINLKNNYGETPLMTAVESNSLKVAKLLLDAGAIDEIMNDNEEFGPLHTAVSYGFRDMVKILLDAGIDANVIDEEHSSPLHLAAKVVDFDDNGEQNHEIVKLLIDAGSDVNAVDFQAITALHLAVMRGNYNIAALLLDAGATVDVMDENMVTPLHWSVRDRNLDFTRRLLEAGADVDTIDCRGMTCLHYAVKMLHRDMTCLLLGFGATANCTDAEGHSPLHWAVRDASLDFVKILLEAGADVNIQDDEDAEGLSVLQVAAKLGLKDIILILLEHGADVKAKCNRGYSVLYYAAMSKRIGSNVDDDLYVEILELLLARGADIDDGSYNIKTPINSVLLYGNEGAVRLFIEHGFDLSKSTLSKSKISSLHHAALNKDKGVLKFLVDSGHFDIEDKCGSGLTALHLAAFSNKHRCVKFLLKKGANINNDNMYGETPLFSAIVNGHSESVRLLLDNGANIEAKTTRNESILDAALEANKQDILRYVVRHIAKLELQHRRLNQFDLIAQYEDLQLFYEDCRAELALMEGSFIHGSMSFYNILMSKNISSYVRNEEVVNTFKTQDLTEYFPIYHDLLTNRFSKELKREELMKKAMRGLSRILRCDADTFHVIFYNIFRYINKSDLRNLIVV